MRDSPKPAKVTRPSRRPALKVFLVDARNSERKKPKGMKATRLDSFSTDPCPGFRNMREKSKLRS